MQELDSRAASQVGQAVGAAGGEREFSLPEIGRRAWAGLPGNKFTAWKAIALFLVVQLALAVFLWCLHALPTYLFLGASTRNEPGLVGPLLISLILVPMTAGLWFVGVALARGQRPNPLSLFEWYEHTFKLLLVIILSNLMVVLGILCFVVPGVYLLISYQLAIPLAVDRKLGPWEAMEESRRLIGPCWLRVFALDLIATAILLGSVLLLGIPLIWVMPALLIAWGLFYDTLAGARDETVRRTLRHTGRSGLPRRHNS